MNPEPDLLRAHPYVLATARFRFGKPWCQLVAKSVVALGRGAQDLDEGVVGEARVAACGGWAEAERSVSCRSWSSEMFDSEVVRQKYSKVARIYDLTMPVFAVIGFSTAARRRAVHALDLEPGDTVLDIGCGTGLNFPFLEEAVGPDGKIIGLDLTPAMLAEARRRIERHGWQNVELIEADVLRADLPSGMDGILATGVMQLVPDHDTVIRKCTEALSSGKRLVILDGTPATGAWRFLNPLFERLTRAFAVSHDGWRREPWKQMREHLTAVKVTKSGPFLYLAVGTKD